MCTSECVSCFFFFQAEDGIRDSSVTGVQTCALPISNLLVLTPRAHRRIRISNHRGRRNRPQSTLASTDIPQADRELALRSPSRGCTSHRYPTCPQRKTPYG